MQNTTGGILPENLNSGTVRYRFSTKFDASYQNYTNDPVMGRWGLIAQLHGHDDYATNPAWSLIHGNSGTPQVLSLDSRTGNLNTNSGVNYPLTDGSMRIGEWIDWIFTVKYGMTAATGSMKIERRNQGSAVFTTVLDLPAFATLQYRPDLFSGLPGDHYFRIGLYGSHQSFVRIVYHDNFTREKL
jgi:hypothetical protein